MEKLNITKEQGPLSSIDLDFDQTVDWWWEPDVRPTKPMKSAIAKCFAGFSRFLGVERLEVSETAAGRSDLEYLL